MRKVFVSLFLAVILLFSMLIVQADGDTAPSSGGGGSGSVGGSSSGGGGSGSGSSSSESGGGSGSGGSSSQSSGGSGGSGSSSLVTGGEKNRFVYDSTISNVVSSYSFSINSEGNVYVADTGDSKIQIYDTSGKIGTISQEFQQPTVVYVDKDDTIFVIDKKISGEVRLGRARKFDKGGNLLFEFQGADRIRLREGEYEFKPGEYFNFHPQAIAIDSNGRVYFAAPGNLILTYSIFIYNSDGTLYKGFDDSRFKHVSGLAFDSNDNLYVIDRSTYEIYVYDKNLNFVKTISNSGNGGFHAPEDIDFDSADKLYVADAINQRIEIIDSSGDYYATVGGNGAGNANTQFSIPVDIEIYNDKLYVLDDRNNRIQIFSSVPSSSGSGGGEGSGGQAAQSDSSSGGGGAGGVGSNENPPICNGCMLDDTCVPIGYRHEGTYCNGNSEFVLQLNADVSCQNNFECSTNLCIDSRCVSSGLWQKFIRWINRLFGD